MTLSDYTLLIVRVVLGVTFAIHGGQKLFGWFGGQGIVTFAQGMSRFGVAHPLALGWMAALSEFVGGLLVLIGLLTPFAAALIISTMFVAIVHVHFQKGFLSTKGGWEYNLSLTALALVLVLQGAGVLSVDKLLGIAMPLNLFPFWTLVVLVLVALGGLATIELSRRMAGETHK